MPHAPLRPLLILLLGAALLAQAPPTQASLLPYATVEERAATADHVPVGRVVDVDMINGRSRRITDPDAMTGPNLSIAIRLVIEVDEALATTAGVVPRRIAVALPAYMHDSLGQVREAHAGDVTPTLVLLKGERFEAAHEAGFRLGLVVPRARTAGARGALRVARAGGDSTGQVPRQ
jgi:hypothetical protein